MTEFTIILLGLWIYPILSFFIIFLTKHRPKLRKQIIIASSILTALAFLGLLTNISTTLSEVDWVLVSSSYFTISLILSWTLFQKDKAIKTIGIISMIIVFSSGYLLGSFKIEGFGFKILDNVTRYEKRLENGIIYKERVTGSQLLGDQIITVEIYKTLSWFPVLEWRVYKTEYKENIPSDCNHLTVNYEPKEGKVYLSSSEWDKKDQRFIYWNDTLFIGK